MEQQNGDIKKDLHGGKKYLLRLYITGSAPRSLIAVNNITQICKNHLDDYELQIIDVYQTPNLAKEDQIIAIPTLVKVLPLPERRVIGDLSDVEKVLYSVELR
jgi:circadian clock protein KaiB